MTLVIPIQEVQEQNRSLVGGKAYALSRLPSLGMDIPDSICISAEAYTRYITLTGLRERILLELNRKSFQEMRWEEMWDTSLRIRNMFLRTPIPSELDNPIRKILESCFGDHAVVVRSSAPEEDTKDTSFAGIHESYINIRGIEQILKHIRLVWASLWSDAALLYRKELGLQFAKSSMAVLIQKIIVGDRSGVIFGINPNDSSQAVIEAVYGLNAGLVDGTIEPDRWILDRSSGRLIEHFEPERNTRLVSAKEGTRLESLPGQLRQKPPLDRTECSTLFDLVRKTEAHFKVPQDMEWTFMNRTLHVLQSRPITTAGKASFEDKRPWYLSLHRSLDNLKALRQKIENNLIPKMIKEADRIQEKDPDKLSDSELAEEIGRRKNRYQYWEDVYRDDFIPFAHGMRLFGRVYNDTVKPDDPFEFMKLLATKSLLSIDRNRNLQTMAHKITQDSRFDNFRKNPSFTDPEFDARLDMFMQALGLSLPPLQKAVPSAFSRKTIIPFILEMAEPAAADNEESQAGIDALAAHFYSFYNEDHQETARELLDLGRASYRLRDDDNIYLGRIKKLMTEALNTGKDRVEKQPLMKEGTPESEDLIRILQEAVQEADTLMPAADERSSREVKARQLVGQPAGPGIASGKARTILQQSDLFRFKKGEILVCDALDPNMTFIVPLSAGIVERRGGMLIHGAIIAREYGIPCVTGIAQATDYIETGRNLTLDGYLGIVILE